MYYRKKCGKGFTYVDENGLAIKDGKLKEWFVSLAIPPAWINVEINEKKSGNLLVTGRDGKGRKQYIYHPNYIKRRNSEKFDRIILFAEKLEDMRRITGQHLRQRKLSREKVIATMVRFLESAFFRPGNESYAKENKTFGLTTLRSKHMSIQGDEMTFTYEGKSGQNQIKHIVDKELAKIVKDIDKMAGYEIFKYLDENNHLVDVKSNDLNSYIHEVMGEGFSAKDFRTWAGTVIAAVTLNEMCIEDVKSPKLINKNIKEAIKQVAKVLGNTPSVARNSYIDPLILDEYLHGRTLRNYEKKINDLIGTMENMSKEEIGVMCMIRNRESKF